MSLNYILKNSSGRRNTKLLTVVNFGDQDESSEGRTLTFLLYMLLNYFNFYKERSCIWNFKWRKENSYMLTNTSLMMLEEGTGSTWQQKRKENQLGVVDGRLGIRQVRTEVRGGQRTRGVRWPGPGTVQVVWSAPCWKYNSRSNSWLGVFSRLPQLSMIL